jgi:hypothetical protein
MTAPAHLCIMPRSVPEAVTMRLAPLALPVLLLGLGTGVSLLAAPAPSPPAANPAAPTPPPAKPAAAPQRPLLERALAGPLRDVREILYVTRLPYDDGHWYANIGYYCDDESRKAYAGNGKPDVGTLSALDLRTGDVRVILDAQGGSIRDPQVHYDGRTILFAWRKAGTDVYHLHEIRSDGTGLRQVTDGPYDDYEPIYLPDGDLLFVSTRCRRWVNCWMTQVGTMFRCRPDGSDVRPVSPNTEHDNTPWVLPDGRVLYMRWEYVDRSQVDYHGLWVMNPDGSGQSVFFGNMRPAIVMIDAKPIPGTDRVLASFSPGHGVTDHAGIATVLTPARGPDAPASARPLHKGKLVRDPWPFAEDCVLAAQDNRLVLIDGSGAVETVHTHAGPGGLHEPRPLAPRPREAVIPPRDRPGEAAGRFVLADVYAGRNLEGVKRGDVRRLLVLESLPKPVNFSGGPDTLTWLGTFTLERVLGTVPVEADGSAYFEAPAGRQLFFVSLDADGRSVKRMQSFTGVAPGETLGCVGCHERRETTAAPAAGGTLLAVRRPPSPLSPFEGLPDVIDLRRDIQPILDRHCVACHGPARRDGGVLLTGHMGPHWTHSYFSLFASRQVADGRNGYGNQPPRTIGSAASPLLAKLDGSHYGAKPSERERRMIWLWIESGATAAGTYACLRNNAQQAAAGHAAGLVFGAQKAVLKRRCGACHELDNPASETGRAIPFQPDFKDRRKRERDAGPVAPYERIVRENDPYLRYSANVLLDFTAPAESALLLAPLAKASGGWERCGPPVFADATDPDLAALRAAIAQGKAALEAAGNFGHAEFRPNPQYLREMRRFGILPAAFDPAREPIDVFDIDQRYWRSLWK